MVSVAIFSPGLKHPGLFFVCTEGVSNVRQGYFWIFIKFMGGVVLGLGLELSYYKVFVKFAVRLWNSVHVGQEGDHRIWDGGGGVGSK